MANKTKRLLGIHEVPDKAKLQLKPVADSLSSGYKFVVVDSGDSDAMKQANLSAGVIRRTDIINDAVNADKLDDLLTDNLGTAGSYGSATSVATFTVDAQGRLTAAGEAAIDTSFDVQSSEDGGAAESASGTMSMTKAMRFDAGEGLSAAISDSSSVLTVSLEAELAVKEQEGVFTAPSNLEIDDIDFSATGSLSDATTSIVLDDDAGSKSAADNDIGSDGAISNKQISLEDSSGNKRIYNVTAKASASSPSNVVTLTVEHVKHVGSLTSPLFLKMASSASDLEILPNKGVATYDKDDFAVAAGVVSLGNSANGAVLAIQGTTNEINVARSAGTVTVSLPDDVTINGSLTVQGDQFEVEGTTVRVEDTLFEMAMEDAGGGGPLQAPSSSTATKDKGLLLHHHDGSDASKKFMGYNSSSSILSGAASGKFLIAEGVVDSSGALGADGTAADLYMKDLYAADLALRGSIGIYDGSAPTDGQILIGDGSNNDFAKGTISAGSAAAAGSNPLSVTNGAGSITIQAHQASTSQLGVASFDSADFLVESGAVTLGGSAKSSVLSKDLYLRMDSSEQPDLIVAYGQARSAQSGTFSVNDGTTGKSGTQAKGDYQYSTDGGSTYVDFEGSTSDNYIPANADRIKISGTSKSNLHSDFSDGAKEFFQIAFGADDSNRRIFNVTSIIESAGVKILTVQIAPGGSQGSPSAYASAGSSFAKQSRTLNDVFSDGSQLETAVGGSSSPQLSLSSGLLLVKPLGDQFLNDSRAGVDYKISMRQHNGLSGSSEEFDEISVPVAYKMSPADGALIDLMSAADESAVIRVKLDIMKVQQLSS